MDGFFWLSAEFDGKDARYRSGIETLAKQIGLKTTFAGSAPKNQSRVEWVSNQLGNCDFAFFDVTAATPDCLIALGMAIENDAQWFALQNSDTKPAFESPFVSNVRPYYGADDFHRKVRTIIVEVQGASMVQHRQLIERIKQKVAKHGALPLRGIAQELGYHPSDIRPVVYSMVAEKILTKVSDKRWARYALRT